MSSAKARIAQLSAEQRALVERRLQLRATRTANVECVEPRRPASGSDVPASAAQRRLWLAQLTDTTGSAYHIHGALRLKGELHVAALDRALGEIVRRHESLRTVFVERAGELLQHVVADVPADVVRTDLTAFDAVGREAAVTAALATQSRVAFDLAKGPLFRFALLKETPTDHVLAITLHHIVADEWSMNVFLSELAGLYDAYRAGRASPLPELPLQCADLAVREETESETAALARGLDYWKNRLASTPSMDLAQGRKAQASGTRPGSSRSRHLSQELASALRNLSLRHQTTLFTTMLALLKALLYHYTQQTDLAVGTTFTNRMRPGTEKLIGFFGNVLILRTDISGGLTFEQLLGRVRDTVLEAFAHGAVPIDRVIEEVRAASKEGSGAAEPPRLQVALEVVQSSADSAAFAGLQVEPVDVSVETAKTDLVLLVQDQADGLLCTIEYDTQLFSGAEIVRMLEHLEELAGAMTQATDQPFMVVPLFRREIAERLNLTPEAVRRYLPLTETQRDLYIGHLIEPDTAAYILAAYCTLDADLDLEAWRRAFEWIVADEDMAHSQLVEIRSHVFQVVGPEVTFAYEVIDLRGESADLAACAERLRRAHFDLERGPVGRMSVMLGTWGSAVAFAVNHVFMDAHSIAMLFRSVGRAYDAIREGREPAATRNVFLDDVAADLGRGDPAAVERFWTAGLRGTVPLGAAVVTPGDPQPIVSRRTVDTDLVKALRTVSQNTGHSVAFTLMGIYAALLGRIYSPGAPFAVYTILGRRNSRSRRALGCFVSNLPYVFPERLLAEDATLTDWIAFAAGYRQELGAMENVPASTVKRILGAEGTKFGFNYFPSSMVDAGGQSVVLDDSYTVPANEFQLRVKPEDEGLELKLSQDARQGGDREFLERLVHVVRQAAAGVRRVADLDLLLPEERRRALPAAGPEEAAAPSQPSFIELFEDHAARTPDAIAAACDGVELSYAELKHRSECLAASLAARGVGPETGVALLGDRSLAFLTAILAVFKAGGAYLPLDPRHPEARWRHALVEARCPLVLADPALIDRLVPALSDVPDVERPRVMPLGPGGEPDATRVDRRGFPESLAYVIYTSGSTGVPKGAMLEQRGMANHLRIKIDEFALTSRDVVAQTASQSFDISVWQFLAPLASGGRVEILPDAIAFDPTRLLAEAERTGVTVLETVPSLLRAALDHAARSDGAPELTRLRLLVLTGEALPPDLCRAWLECYPAIPIVNAYGPTECSDDVTHHVIASAPAPNEARVPIGHSLTNMRLYVLDRAMRPVPPGVWGELYVGGPGVGRGYVNAPGATAAAFVPDPFGGIPGGRLYRTGDQVRLRGDGAFEFLGRLDHQVKIRGHRIELDEIAAVISRQPGVQDCAVIARAFGSDAEPSLAAYVVPDPVLPPAMAGIRAALKQTLPEYMVPSALMLLETLPLTPNGKLDRAALPEPERDASLASGPVPPRDLLERQLLEIWEELLTVRPIGVTDGFFDVGGHSLLAVRMLGRIKERFGRELPLTALFTGQTIEALAETLRWQVEALPPSPLVALQPRGMKPPLFCVHPGSGNVLCFYHLARRFAPDRPVYGLQDPALYGGWGFDVAIEDMAARYVQEIRTVQPEGPYNLCGWSYGGQIAFEMARQLTAAGSAVGLLAILDTGAPEAVTEFRTRADEAVLASIVVQEWGLSASAEDIRRLEPSARLETLGRRLREEHGLVFANAAWLGDRVERFQARLRALEAYRPDPYSGPLVLIRAAETGIDDDVASDYPDDPTIGWQAFSHEDVAVHVVPGSHATMAEEPHVASLVEQLETCLSASVARAHTSKELVRC